jgi:hypothetical protein
LFVVAREVSSGKRRGSAAFLTRMGVSEQSNLAAGTTRGRSGTSKAPKGCQRAVIPSPDRNGSGQCGNFDTGACRADNPGGGGSSQRVATSFGQAFGRGKNPLPYGRSEVIAASNSATLTVTVVRLRTKEAAHGRTRRPSPGCGDGLLRILGKHASLMRASLIRRRCEISL